MSACQLNINGLSSHCISALDNYLSDHNIAIMALQETGDHINKPPRFTGKAAFFKFVTHGVGILVNPALKPQLVPSLCPNNMEFISVMCTIDNENVLICSAYCPPSDSSLKPLLEVVQRAWSYCKSNGVNSMICFGDFNARNVVWGDHRDNSKGKELQNMLDSKQDYYLSSPGMPTFVSLNPAGSSVIDLVISAGNISSQIQGSFVDVETELFSGAPVRGHYPIFTNLSYSKLKCKEFDRLDLYNCDWESWTEYLETRVQYLLPLLDEEHTPDLLLSSLSSAIAETNTINIPTKKVCCHSKPYWSSTLKLLSGDLREKRARFSSRSTPRNKQLHEEAKVAFTDALITEKNDWVHRKLEGLNVRQSEEFWSKYKHVFGSLPDNSIGNLSDEGVLITNDTKKEDLMFKTFFKGGHLKNRNFDEDHYQEINRELTEIINEVDDPEVQEDDTLNSRILLSEVNDAIAKQKMNDKSMDTYGIHPIMLKKFGSKTRDFINRLFNIILSDGKWQWTDSLTSMIKKEGKDDYMKPGSYRPICISSYLGKIMERILERRLVVHAVGEGIIDEAQEGFLPRKNTSRYLYRMIASLKEAQRAKLTSLLLLIDFEKAYDSVPVSCLIVKLHRLGIKGRILKLLYSFLSTRTTKLKINDSIGPLRILELIGLPQGAVLAPILFILYVSDLLDHKTLPVGARQWAQSFKFADDGSVVVVADNISDCISTMQIICDYISEWCRKWRLVINCSKNKTETMVIQPKKSDTITPGTQLKISGKSIAYVSQSRVLGLIIDDRLTFEGHAKSKLRACWYAWHTLSKKTNRSRGLNSSSLLMLFKCIVLNKILYASPVWLKSNTHIFRDFFARVQLKIVGAEFYPPNDVMGALLGLPPLEVMDDINSLKFILKCLTTQDIMSGMAYQLEVTPKHPFYSHIILVKQFLAWDSGYSTRLNNRNLELATITNTRRFFYTKETINKYQCFLWNRRLNSETSKLFADTDIAADMNRVQEHPLVRRCEKRKDNIHYLDFIHGRSCRFMNFRKTVGRSVSNICEDCNVMVDSAYHKLFICPTFDGIFRQNFIDNIGDTDYRESVIFSLNIEVRRNYRYLVDHICQGSSYDYLDILS